MCEKNNSNGGCLDLVSENNEFRICIMNVNMAMLH